MPTSPARRAARRGHAPIRARGITPADLLKTDEACAYLRVSKTTLRQYIADGLIHPIRLGPKSLRFDPVDLDGCHDRHRVGHRTRSQRQLRAGLLSS